MRDRPECRGCGQKYGVDVFRHVQEQCIVVYLAPSGGFPSPRTLFRHMVIDLPPHPQRCVVFDLEGVLFPEIWPAVAARFSLPALARTTRDVANYDELMRGRIQLLAEHDIGLTALCDTIAALDPLPGAREVLDEVRACWPVLILSDTFEEFARIVAPKFGYPAFFCHRLVVEDDKVVSYKLRRHDQKRAAVEAMQRLGFHVLAVGDLFNDLSMLHAANRGVLVNAPPHIAQAHQIFPVYESIAAARPALFAAE